MKKLTSAFFIIMLISSFSFAQGGFRIGARGGVNNTWLYNNNRINDDSIKHDITFSGYGGLALGYDATFYNFGIYVDILFKQISQKYVEDKPAPAWNSQVKLKYISIPIMLRFRSAGDAYKKTFTYGGAYFEIGVEPSFISSASDKYTSQDTNKTKTTLNLDVKDSYEGLSLEAIIGFGFHQIGTETWSVTHGLRGGYGLLDVKSTKGGKGTKYINSKGIESDYKKTRPIFLGYMLTIQYRIQRGVK